MYTVWLIKAYFVLLTACRSLGQINAFHLCLKGRGLEKELVEFFERGDWTGPKETDVTTKSNRANINSSRRSMW